MKKRNKKEKNDIDFFDLNSNRNYEICWLQICPFEVELRIKNEKLLKPIRNGEYKYRLCVLDVKNKLAVDVLLEMQYQYIETSLINFIGEEAKKIQPNKRYACFKLPIDLKKVDSDTITKAVFVINNLKDGNTYRDGNLVDNEEYIGLIKMPVKERVKKL